MFLAFIYIGVLGEKAGARVDTVEHQRAVAGALVPSVGSITHPYDSMVTCHGDR